MSYESSTHRNSLFTSALLSSLDSHPGVPVQHLLAHARQALVMASNGAQVPWVTSSLSPGCAVFLCPSPSHVALVVGCSAYTRGGHQPRCLRDARLVARLLVDVSYTVSLVVDPSQQQLVTGLTGLVDALAPDCTVVVYFCGRLARRNGAGNLAALVPVDGDVQGGAAFCVIVRALAA